MRIRWIWAGIAALTALAASSLLLGAARTRSVIVQPMPFNHEVHVKGEEMDCSDCHAGADEPVAGFGAIRDCHQCHKEVQGDEDSDLQQQVRQFGKDRREIPWVQVNRNAGHVYFSHRAHVTIAGMSCEECHGDVGSMTTPPESPTPDLLSMDACMSCHAERGATLQCIACHK